MHTYTPHLESEQTHTHTHINCLFPITVKGLEPTVLLLRKTVR